MSELERREHTGAAKTGIIATAREIMTEVTFMMR